MPSRFAIGACTSPAAPAHPDAEWVTQQARHVAWTVAERGEPVRVLIRDHDGKFTRSFDDVFRGARRRLPCTRRTLPKSERNPSEPNICGAQGMRGRKLQ